jgi:single-strand selective monofunctional uracil DNA glycosylase
MSEAASLLQAAKELRSALAPLCFSAPTAHVYNPLDYAWAPFAAYVEKFATGPKRVLFLGMNPGPFGMMQVGVPFGEVAAVRDWMGISAAVERPAHEHPKRLIEGFACTRSEVSGRRLWGWAAKRFGQAEDFFREHFVVNYCPLVWLEDSGRNRTPDKLPAAEMAPVTAACDAHLLSVIQTLQPEWALGVGGFAEKCLQRVCRDLPAGQTPRVDTILHPSPASPAANRGWEEAVEKKLRLLGLIA